jgi:hypothetical protein
VESSLQSFFLKKGNILFYHLFAGGFFHVRAKQRSYPNKFLARNTPNRG